MGLFNATTQFELDRSSAYQAPELTIIGHVADVVLGVIGSGDDNMGYTSPEFEFEPDGELLDGKP